MSDPQHRRLSSDQFFSRHYARVSGWLNAFAHAHHRARKSEGAVKAAALAEMIDTGRKLFDESLTIWGGGVAPAGGDGPRAFFDSAARLRATLARGDDAQRTAETELAKHLDYFHGHVPDAQIDSAAATEPQAIYLRECMANTVHVLARNVLNFEWHCPDPRQVTSFFDTSAAEARITPAARTILQDVLSLEGWCSPQKALLLYDLIREHKPLKVVEIGIYGGRSIVPIAAALRDNGAGEVWGIETWSGAGATSHRTSIDNDFSWLSVDFTKIKGDFLEFVLRHGLHDTIRVVEASSDRCGGLFDRIDMLHIDGNHSMYQAAQDVVTYLSKVPSGGIIVYDDIDWTTTAAGLEILRDTCRLLHVVPTVTDNTIPGCAAFMKV